VELFDDMPSNYVMVFSLVLTWAGYRVLVSDNIGWKEKLGIWILIFFMTGIMTMIDSRQRSIDKK
jgi:hypothetical protein